MSEGWAGAAGTGGGPMGRPAEEFVNNPQRG